MKLLLMGNPNVGKSTFFSRLTGINVMISNYSGTTIELKKGKMKFNNKLIDVIDVPGINTLEPLCKAEEVAVKMLKEGDLIINVVDATNLERSLYLTFQLMEKNIPIVVALNFWNETKHKGIEINIKKLEELLGIPVIPTVALTGEGIKEVVFELKKKPLPLKKHSEEKWIGVGKIVKDTQKIKNKEHSFLDRLEDLSIKPLTGIPLAFLILFFSFYLVWFIGETIIYFIFGPLFEFYFPFLVSLSNFLGPGFFHDILIGSLINGKIDFVQSMGLLSTGLFVPIAMVLPYVFSFYFVLGFLEDSGYLPRLATLIDNLMHRFGMHGLAVIPMLLGLGCNVPGALAVRILETKRQRFIAATLMAISVPCMAQIAMIFGLLGSFGVKGLIIVFGTLFIVWITLGFFLNKVMKGLTPETFMEIPPYRMPYLNSLIKKLWMRLKNFLTEAIPFVFLGVLIINFLFVFGVIDFISRIASPLVVGVLGLPKEAVISLVIGFLRKDMAIGLLLPLNLTLKQLIISSVVLTMYFPCVATFVVLFKELGLKDLIKSTLLMIFLSFLAGGILNLIL